MGFYSEDSTKNYKLLLKRQRKLESGHPNGNGKCTIYAPKNCKEK